MEKIQKGSPEYFLIDKEFIALIENITREKQGKDSKKFIGGLPVTLERKDIFSILSKDLSGNYRYSITQKVDGTRLLMFANFKNDTGPITGLRNITFIDRNNDFYTLKNKTREALPDFNGPKFLIDGELVVFDNENKIVNPTERYMNIKSFSFMAFDILYGPISIEYSGPPGDKRLNIGSEGAMAGPIGGKMWSYQKRYDILYQLLVPNVINDHRPILSLAFKECQWFVPEIKSIYFINALRTNKELYKAGDNKAFFQENLIKFRRTYYELINQHVRNKQQHRAELINVSLDGLIFTPFDTEYVINGPWKKFLNVQYKWKPIEEQSIDFAIYKQGSTYLLKIRKGANLVTFTVNKNGSYVPAELSPKTITELKNSKTRDSTIGEFIMNTKTNQFELLRLRKDKDSPNSLSTAINVMNAIKNPVDLEIIKKFFISNKLSTLGLKELMNYMTKSQLLRCVVNNGGKELFSPDIQKELLQQIEQFKSNEVNELEIRIGTIEPSKFQANLAFTLYKQLMDLVSFTFKGPNIKIDYSILYDLYRGPVRTRYMYLPDLGSTVNVESIEKKTIKNMNIDLNYLYNLDLRVGLSSEIPSEDSITKENTELTLEKKRYSFMFDIFSIDLTEVIKINKTKDDKTGQMREVREAPKYQVEIEIKNKTLPATEILQKIMVILIKLLGNINS